MTFKTEVELVMCLIRTSRQKISLPEDILMYVPIATLPIHTPKVNIDAGRKLQDFSSR